VGAAAADGVRSVVVEFVGVPGAGKSTLAERAAAQLRALGVPVHLHAHPAAPDPAPRSRLEKYLRYTKYLPAFVAVGCRHPAFAARTTSCVLRSGQRSLWDAAKVLHNLFRMTRLLRRCRRRHGVHLVDQGVLQSLWAVAYSAGSSRPDTLPRLASAFVALPDVAVVVKAPAPVLRGRLVERAVAIGRLDAELRHDPSALARAVESVASVEAALASSRWRHAVRLLSVDNTDPTDLDASVDHICGSIRIDEWTLTAGSETAARPPVSSRPPLHHAHVRVSDAHRSARPSDTP
jgi:hypothetical protein